MLKSFLNSPQKWLYLALFFATALPFINSAIALVMGFIFAVTLGNPLSQWSQKTSKLLLKFSVIGLGFGVNIEQVIEVGRSSLVLTVISITAIIGMGELLGHLLKVKRNTSVLISFGTAICGGSAIAAMSPIIKAKDEEIAVALATVFSLNAIALVVFPYLGHYFELTEHQFGIWAALAIHDTSSVVGASAVYGATAVAVATTVKLTRAMWIIPYCVAAGAFTKSEERASIPLFIIGFVLAAVINSYLPDFSYIWSAIYDLAKHLLVMTLFLIGAGLTKEVLKKVGLQPFILGTILWVIVSATILMLILDGYIK